MSKELLEQLVGNSYKCIEYDTKNFYDHFDRLREADEFAAAASLYADERYELLANAGHRYQLVLDKAVESLKLNIDFLNKKRIWFNFYTDIANRFGLGTQAYTTEAECPHIGVSELSLQDITLLQLILLHEFQHATDFAYLDGLKMSVAERELRARISVCQALKGKKQKHYLQLYQNSVTDQAYWFVILYHSVNTPEEKKLEYYNLLEPVTQKRLSNQDIGVSFPPIVLRILSKELNREKIILKSDEVYHIWLQKGKLVLNTEKVNLMIPDNTDKMEEIIVEHDENNIQQNQESLKTLGLSNLQDDETKKPVIKNKVGDWYSYESQYKLLKKQAHIVITRNMESFSNISDILPVDIAEDEDLSPPEIQYISVKGGDEFKELDNLEIPDSQLETVKQEESVSLQPLQSTVKRKNTFQHDEEILAEDVMNNLSDFIKEKKTKF